MLSRRHIRVKVMQVLYAFNGTESEIIISQYKDGKYTTEYETLRLNFIGLPFEIDYVEVDNLKISRSCSANGVSIPLQILILANGPTRFHPFSLPKSFKYGNFK